MAWSFWNKLKDIGNKVCNGAKKGRNFMKPVVIPIGGALAPVVGRLIDSEIPGAGAGAQGVWRKVSGKPAKTIRGIFKKLLVNSGRLKPEVDVRIRTMFNSSWKHKSDSNQQTTTINQL
jgi:hypothetical protein